jgi:flagellar hook-associated protein FlgK
MSAQNLFPVLQQIQQNIQSIGPNDQQARQVLLKAARALVSALETPTERLTRMSYYEVYR